MIKLHAKRGFPQPFGISLQPEGVNFALFSSSAASIALCLFKRDSKELIAEIPLDPSINKTGHVWHLLLQGLARENSHHFCYAYRIDNKPFFLIDPYGRGVATPIAWGARQAPQEAYHPLGTFDFEEPFDWEGVASPRYAIQDLIIYEMHVRRFTCHPSSGVRCPGSFLGLAEKIPALLALGVNAVELLPMFEFDEQEVKVFNPTTGQLLCNFWGYSSVNF